MTKTAQLVVLTNAQTGQDEAFNHWYDDVHLGDVLLVPGIVAAQRFEALTSGDETAPYRYSAVYDIKAADPTAVVKEIFRRFASGEMTGTTAMGADMLSILYTPRGDKRHAKTS